MKIHTALLTPAVLLAAALTGQSNLLAETANPTIPFYGGGGAIVANPQYPIVGETAHITVTVGNTSATDAATNVRVKISFNDWGVTFFGWQEIATVTIASIPPGGTAIAAADYIFQNRTHTCLEALVLDADANGDPNDDRGQINLEVINSGETFSYGVPVQNNGDQPLNLLLIGHCVAKGGTAGQDGRHCKDEAKEVQLDPGEEILVPVDLDLAGVPLGQEVVFVLDAYVLGIGGDGFLPANHNHVEIHVVHQTPLNLKKTALATLNGLVAQVPNRALQNRIKEAAKAVDHALKSSFWNGVDRLDKSGGAQVFADEQAALNQVLLLLEADLPMTVKAPLNKLALDLTDADRILAQTADAASGGTAAALIDEGDAHRAAGQYLQAVVSYKNAWHTATK
jgi:hypothetical protein